jgi:hypothetical protein
VHENELSTMRRLYTDSSHCNKARPLPALPSSAYTCLHLEHKTTTLVGDYSVLVSMMMKMSGASLYLASRKDEVVAGGLACTNCSIVRSETLVSDGIEYIYGLNTHCLEPRAVWKEY